MTRLILASMVLMVSGCSSFLKSEAPPVQIYVLRAAESPREAAAGEAQALSTARSTAAAESPAGSASGDEASPPTLQVPRPQAEQVTVPRAASPGESQVPCSMR